MVEINEKARARTMSDHPILFSVSMVRALLAGRKTQTRRVLKPQPVALATSVADFSQPFYCDYKNDWGQFKTVRDGLLYKEWHPLGSVRYAAGDRLWVREAWHAARSHNSTPPRDIPRDASIEHAATARNYAEIGLKGKLRPGMFLPRWASRITLIVTDVRVQQLQEISDEDAKAEGVYRDGERWTADGVSFGQTPVEAFERLWCAINGDRAWTDNPWIAVYTFDILKTNIDQTLKRGTYESELS